MYQSFGLGSELAMIASLRAAKSLHQLGGAGRLSWKRTFEAAQLGAPASRPASGPADRSRAAASRFAPRDRLPGCRDPDAGSPAMAAGAWMRRRGMDPL